MDQNRELLQKMLTSGDFFTAGALKPEQADRFIGYVRGSATLLRAVRFVQMERLQKEIDKMWLGEPITEGAAEATGPGSDGEAAFTRVTLTAEKVRSRFPYSVETLVANIEQAQFEQTIIQRLAQRFGVDMENMALNGNSAITGATKEEKLLKIMDGWKKLSESGHVVDAAGATIRKELFAEALYTLPDDYRGDPDLRFFLAPVIGLNWMSTLSDRGDAIGVDALRGEAVRPYGVPLFEVPKIPTTLPVTVSGVATPAQIVGKRFGPFVIRSGVNDTFVLNFNGSGAGPISIVFPQGTYEDVLLVKMLNDAITASGITGLGFCRSTNDGRVLIETVGSGAAFTILVGADGPPPGAGPSTANDTLGFTAGTYTGANAPAGGALNEGSYMLLTNPRNLLFGIVNVPRVGDPQAMAGLDGVRMYTKYDQDTDSVIVTMYNHVAVAIENIDACVLVKNIKRKSLF